MKSTLSYSTTPSKWTNEYYQYCGRLIEEAFEFIEEPVNVIFGSHDYDKKGIHIDIQSEHTLVKMGGRSVDEVIWGEVDLLHEEGKYLVRIPNYKYYESLDGVIEYSMPNIYNISTNDRFKDYLKKVIYVAPLIYDEPSFKSNKRLATIMLSNNSDRRQLLQLQSDGMIGNIQNILSGKHLKLLYDKTKILVNIHQTNEHHTLEELRILPALMNGVIVVSEEVPLKDKVPYGDAIVWSSYNNILNTVQEVQENYVDYYQRIFTDDFKQQLEGLRESNIQNIVKLLS